MQRIMSTLVFLALVSLMSVKAFADVIWIDVRTETEYRADHIDGAINIPHQEIEREIGHYANNTMTTINLYCASGRRAEKAKNKLEKMGYKDVTNHGGIEDVRALNNMLQQ